MSVLSYLDLIGVYVFAISGGLVAIRHKLDILGVFVICLLPAIGGGTLRDLLLDVSVFWLDSPMIIFVALAGGLSAIIYKYWTRVRLLVWVDGLGLALFARRRAPQRTWRTCPAAARLWRRRGGLDCRRRGRSRRGCDP